MTTRRIARKRAAGEDPGQRNGIEYLWEPPTFIPPGKVLVHNVEALSPNRALGSMGFRAWLADPDQTNQQPCDCGWAGIGPHFRTRHSQ